IIEDESPSKSSRSDRNKKTSSSDEKTRVAHSSRPNQSNEKVKLQKKDRRSRSRSSLKNQRNPFARLKDQFIKPAVDYTVGHRTPTGPQFEPPVIDLKEEKVIYRSQKKKNRLI